MKIISLGEVLWDILPGAEHLGGAPFNFALHARNLGHDVSFISAVGNDDRGRRALELMEQRGLSTRFVCRTSDHPTGTVTVSLDPSLGPQYHIHRPAAYDFPALNPADLSALLTPPPSWIYFGTLQQMSVPARDLTRQLLDAAPAASRFYDVNLRTGSYRPNLVRDLIHQAHVLKLNHQELPFVKEMCGIEAARLEQFCREIAAAFELETVCVTAEPRAARSCWMANMSKRADFPFSWLMPSARATPFPLPCCMAFVQVGRLTGPPILPIALALSSPAAPAVPRTGQ